MATLEVPSFTMAFRIDYHGHSPCFYGSLHCIFHHVINPKPCSAIEHCNRADGKFVMNPLSHSELEPGSTDIVHIGQWRPSHWTQAFRLLSSNATVMEFRTILGYLEMLNLRMMRLCWALVGQKVVLIFVSHFDNREKDFSHHDVPTNLERMWQQPTNYFRWLLAQLANQGVERSNPLNILVICT